MQPVHVVNPEGTSSVVLVCEHAAREIPPEFNNLGLSAEVLKSHVAWDPGALAVAEHLSRLLDAPLVAGGVSRLIYDCNRSPDAPDSMPARSEIFDIPGNANLDCTERVARVNSIYQPFRAALAGQIKRVANPVIVTIHSFTPVYHGEAREVEIGVLHDEDTRLANSLFSSASHHTDLNIQRNQPYGLEDGVTHTLQEHALPDRHLNVMLEVRNDLVADEAAQERMAVMLAAWLAEAFAATGLPGVVKCPA